MIILRTILTDKYYTYLSLYLGLYLLLRTILTDKYYT